MAYPQAPIPQPVSSPSGGVVVVRTVTILFTLGLAFAIIYGFFYERGGFSFFAGLTVQQFSRQLMPLFGLVAFFLVWAQIIIGPNMRWWRKAFPRILTYHRLEGIFAFVFACVHPILLLIAVGINNYLHFTFVDESLIVYAILGEIQLVLLIVTVLTALLRNQPWLVRRWRTIHYLNYVIFVFAWIHSSNLGSDLQEGMLYWIWVAFGITGACSIAYKIFRALKVRTAKTAVQNP